MGHGWKESKGMIESTDDLEQIFEQAVKEAEKRRHEYVTIEHLLLALVKDKGIGTMLVDFKVNVGWSSIIWRALLTLNTPSEPVILDKFIILSTFLISNLFSVSADISYKSSFK